MKTERSVTRNGICYNALYYYSEKLLEHIGEKVCIKIHEDNKKISVYDMNDNFICIAHLESFPSAV